ncbi:uncharacterized [Tachysurus ichikawai]
MPSGTCSASNTTLVSEYDGQDGTRYADLKGIPTNHAFHMSYRGLQRPDIKSVRWEYHIAMMLNLSVTVMQPFGSCDGFLFSLPAAVLLIAVVLFFRGTSDIQ